MNEEPCRFAGYFPPFGVGSMLGSQIKLRAVLGRDNGWDAGIWS